MIKILSILLMCALLSCGNKGKEEAGTTAGTGQAAVAATTPAPAFDADSAYRFVEAQVAFGPRVPNTEGHVRCGDYLISELKRFGAEMYVQEMTLTAYNGERLACRNIIGSYNKDNPRRILLFAHWDTRPYADHDADPGRIKEPIDGADDGASGVGVLLEIARQLNRQAPGMGIDIIFFDAEDYGAPDFAQSNQPDTWCLGSQFWAKNPHQPNYKADYGILLDMVGSKNATFYREATSMRYAARTVEMVWSLARDLGYGRFFVNSEIGPITDDHQYVIAGRGIPSIDIINYAPENDHGFGSHWHTHNDTMDVIDRATLKAVGETVLNVIYKNK